MPNISVNLKRVESVTTDNYHILAVKGTTEKYPEFYFSCCTNHNNDVFYHFVAADEGVNFLYNSTVVRFHTSNLSDIFTAEVYKSIGTKPGENTTSLRSESSVYKSIAQIIDGLKEINENIYKGKEDLNYIDFSKIYLKNIEVTTTVSNVDEINAKDLKNS